jgi:hypothetical protein
MYIKTVLAVCMLFVLVNDPALCQNQHWTPDRGNSQQEYSRDDQDWRSSEIRIIKEKLKNLDQNYITKLRSRDEERAGKILDEVYSLLDKLEAGMYQDAHPTPLPPPQPQAVNPVDFSRMLESIKHEPFGDNKLAVVKTISQSNFFTVAQTIEVIKLLNMSDEKITALELMYPKILDRANGYLIINEFTFNSDKENAQRIISGR